MHEEDQDSWLKDPSSLGSKESREDGKELKVTAPCFVMWINGNERMILQGVFPETLLSWSPLFSIDCPF